MHDEARVDTFSAHHYLPAPIQDDSELVQVNAHTARKLRNAILSAANGVELSDSVSLQSEKNEQANSLEKLYPGLLVASLLLAASFCFLYLTKPVVEISAINSSKEPVVAIESETTKSEQLLPWPDEEPLLPSPVESSVLRSSPASLAEQVGNESTHLKMQQVLLVEGPEQLREKIEVEQKVGYPTRLLRWDQETIRRARLLKQEIARHLNDVRIVKENGKHLMTEWESLVLESMPTEVLRADSPSLPRNSYFVESHQSVAGGAHNE